MVPPL
jgi:putative SOS response-associated peptidase YedK